MCYFPSEALDWLPSARRRDERERQQRPREDGMRAHATFTALTTTNTLMHTCEDAIPGLSAGNAEIEIGFSSAWPCCSFLSHLPSSKDQCFVIYEDSGMDWRFKIEKMFSVEKMTLFINVSVVPLGVQLLLSLWPSRMELTPAGVAKFRCRPVVVGGAVRRHVESAEWRCSLARVVDSQRRGNALGVWHFYAEFPTIVIYSIQKIKLAIYKN